MRIVVAICLSLLVGTASAGKGGHGPGASGRAHSANERGLKGHDRAEYMKAGKGHKHKRKGKGRKTHDRLEPELPRTHGEGPSLPGLPPLPKPGSLPPLPKPGSLPPLPKPPRLP